MAEIASGEQAEERTAREGRAKEWLSNAFTEKWNCKALDFSNDHVIGESVETLSELLAEYAESECSRLASRVGELEKLLDEAAQFVFDCAEESLFDTAYQEKAAKCFGRIDRALLAGAHAEEKE